MSKQLNLINGTKTGCYEFQRFRDMREVRRQKQEIKIKKNSRKTPLLLALIVPSVIGYQWIRRTVKKLASGFQGNYQKRGLFTQGGFAHFLMSGIALIVEDSKNMYKCVIYKCTVYL